MKAGTAARLVLAVAGVLIAGSAGAQGFGGGQAGGPGFSGHRAPMERGFGPNGGGKSWWNNPKVVERLKLTDDQRKAMDGIMLEHREKLIDLHANLEKAELGMQPLMSADTPNDSAIVAQIDKVVTARGDLERANARFLLAIRDKLTPDQWKQVKDVRANGGMRGGEQGQRWGRDGQRPGMHGPGMNEHGMNGSGGQGPGGPGAGMQFRHRQGPPPQTPPAAAPGTAPAPAAGPGGIEQ